MTILRGMIAVLLLAGTAAAQQTFSQQLGPINAGPVAEEEFTQVPFITWGGDVATFVANGGLTTTPDSIMGKAGLKLKLVSGDDFPQQVKDYMSGKSPYIRGTMGMLALASEVFNKDPRTKPVVFVQMTWSAGDHIVARESIKSLNDLKGKTICMQRNGPHLVLLDDSLKAAGLTWDDVKIVWAKNLTGPDSPAELFRKDSSIDAACVISPDMIGLCSGIDQKGTGAEGTVAGSHVVNSTAQMSHSIPDVYGVRRDYFDRHRAKVAHFQESYLKSTEVLLAAKKAYDDGKGNSPEYIQYLKLAQSIYGQQVLPTIENDAHGLVSDAVFARIPGNELFFNDPNNLVGFQAKQSAALDLVLKLGLVKDRFGFEKASWDYKAVSTSIGVPYVPPVFATGRIKGEVTDFAKDLDQNTIFSFEIRFEPEQTTFSEDSYAGDFMRVIQNAQVFGNAVILVQGHSDPTLALQNFFWAARAKGLITGQNGSYQFKGQGLDLADTNSVVAAIQSENFAGLTRRNSEGQIVPIDDPKTTVAAALQLSQSRAIAVKDSIVQYAKKKGYSIDLTQIQPQGVGITDPVNARPRNMQQAKENMRVVFKVIKVKAEKLSEGDFDFENK